MMAYNHKAAARNIRLAFWNADGILSQTYQFNYFLREHKIDLLLLQESHLHPTNKWKIRNYKILRPNRLEPKGGTAIIYKPHLSLQPLDLPALQTLEVTEAKLETPDSPIIFISAYKKPNTSIQTVDIRKLSRLGTRIIIAGDLNCKHPFWNSRASNQSGKILFNLKSLDAYCHSRSYLFSS